MVTSKIDSLTVAIQEGSFSVDNDFVGVDWDSWVDGGYKRKHKSYGLARGWSFTCWEDVAAVPWTSSVAKHLKECVADGLPVSFEYVNGTRYATPAGQTVYVESVEVWYSAAMKVRYFTVTLKGA
jgi:hypothetical protein